MAVSRACDPEDTRGPVSRMQYPVPGSSQLRGGVRDGGYGETHGGSAFERSFEGQASPRWLEVGHRWAGTVLPGFRG